MTLRIRIVGNGRAGGSLAGALEGRAQVEVLGRGDLTDAARDVDLIVLAVPDRSIAACAASIRPADAVVIHLSGVTGLDALAPHPRVGSLHPLVSFPDATQGARRFRGAWMAVAGDPAVDDLARLLDGRTFHVADDQRALYHAIACIASNHLVALMSQVERLATMLDVPAAPFLELASGALANTVATGAAAALTGPVSRGDWGTVGRHVAALPEADRPLYLALAAEAAALAGVELPAELGA